MRRICFINYKGGTGKTSCVVNVGHGLARKNKRTLIIDTDPQGSAGYYLGVTPKKSLYNVLIDNEPLTDSESKFYDYVSALPNDKSPVIIDCIICRVEETKVKRAINGENVNMVLW